MTYNCFVMLCNDLDEYQQDLGEITLSNRPHQGEAITSKTLYQNLPDSLKRKSPGGLAHLIVIRIGHIEGDERLMVFAHSVIPTE